MFPVPQRHLSLGKCECFLEDIVLAKMKPSEPHAYGFVSITIQLQDMSAG